MNDAFISMTELARRLGFSVFHLYRKASALGLKKINGRWWITEADAKKLEQTARKDTAA
jgi:hypothetical protein